MDFLIDIILKGICITVWTVIIQGPLLLIAAVEGIFSYLTTGIVWDVLFNGQKAWELDNIPSSFWTFCIVSFFMGIIIFVVQYLTFTFNEELQTKVKLIKTLKSTALAIVFVFFIPIGFYSILVLLDFLQVALKYAFGKDEISLADMLYKIGDNTWDGSATGIKENYVYPDNIVEDYNLLVEILSVAFMLYALVNLCMAVVTKSVELFTLFLLGPVTACWMVNDGGVKMKNWKDDVFAKAFGSLATIISYMIMTNFLIVFLSIAIEKFNFFERQLMLVIVILGVGVFATTAPVMISRYLGTEGISHADSAAVSSMGGKFLRTGGRMLGAALGVGLLSEKFLKKKASSAAGGIGSVASNMLGMGGEGEGGFLAAGKENLVKAQEMGKEGGLYGFARKARNFVRGATFVGAVMGGTAAAVKLTKHALKPKKVKLAEKRSHLAAKQAKKEDYFENKTKKLKNKSSYLKLRNTKKKHDRQMEVFNSKTEKFSDSIEQIKQEKTKKDFKKYLKDTRKIVDQENKKNSKVKKKRQKNKN